MKRKNLRYRFCLAIVALSSATMFFSCKKIYDVAPETTLDASKMYRDVYDANAAVLGVYGKLAGVAKQYVLLNELRADLMTVTTNADESLKQLNEQNTAVDNPYTSPRPFYAVINECNDILKNFDIMRAAKKFTEQEYQQRYCDIGALRCWLYLQLGIHYGQVPYVTDPLETIDAVKDVTKYPKLPFNILLDSLVAFGNRLQFLDPYPSGSTLIVNYGLLQSYFISKYQVLGDINLWKGNYNAAATYYRQIMEGSGYTFSGATFTALNAYKERFASVADYNDLNVQYVRFSEQDINSLVDNNTTGWRSMFARSQDALFNTEMLWVIPFSNSGSPSNPFIDLFSNVGGSYLVKPAQAAIDNWNSQRSSFGYPFDARGRFTYKTLSGQPVIMKYLYNYLGEFTYTPITPLLKEGKWFLMRASSTHLHFAEAANRDGKRKLAFAFLNNGINAAYDSIPAKNKSTEDVTNWSNTLFEPAPYNFDARQGDFPRYRSNWYQAGGMRGKARLVNIVPPATINTPADSTVFLENALINEGALELAYEGQRWPDLLRIALRRNDPSFIADKIYNKLLLENNPQASAVRARLMTGNYYLPFNW